MHSKNITNCDHKYRVPLIILFKLLEAVVVKEHSLLAGVMVSRHSPDGLIVQLSCRKLTGLTSSMSKLDYSKSKSE